MTNEKNHIPYYLLLFIRNLEEKRLNINIDNCFLQFETVNVPNSSALHLCVKVVR